jgi:hypothetical protein
MTVLSMPSWSACIRWAAWGAPRKWPTWWPHLLTATFVNGAIVPVDGGRAVLGHDPEQRDPLRWW